MMPISIFYYTVPYNDCGHRLAPGPGRNGTQIIQITEQFRNDFFRESLYAHNMFNKQDRRSKLRPNSASSI